jgi:hypothetical protein
MDNYMFVVPLLSGTFPGDSDSNFRLKAGHERAIILALSFPAFHMSLK